VKILCLTPICHIPGILEKLQGCGETLYEPNASREEAIKSIEDFGPDALFVNPNRQTYKLDEDILCRGIKVVATASTGRNHIDMESAEKLGVEVLSLTTDMKTIESISSTAEHAFALTLSLIRNVPSSFQHVLKGGWDYREYVGNQLDHLTVGVVGMGRLGRMYARFCTPFFKKTLVCDPYADLGCYSYNSRTLEELVQECDVIALHVHLSDETKGMVNDALLFKAKKEGIYLINTSRGEVVDEASIIHALSDKRLRGYATDVLASELGNIKESPIIEACSYGLNIIITPHIGGMTVEAQQIAYGRIAERLEQFEL